MRQAGDYPAAVSQYRLAAAMDHPPALNSLGEMYRQGLGVDRDYRLAAAFFLRAAEENIAAAQQSLAGMFKYGRYVPENYYLAQAWLDAGQSRLHLMKALRQTMEFIDEAILEEYFSPPEEIPAAQEPAPVVPALRLPEGYIPGHGGRSAKIRREILTMLNPNQALSMLKEALNETGDEAVIADLAADIEWLKNQKDL